MAALAVAWIGASVILLALAASTLLRGDGGTSRSGVLAGAIGALGIIALAVFWLLR